MFAYCRNYPISRTDILGTEDEETKEDSYSTLEDLLEAYAEINENGFTIDIETAAAEWNECIKKLGDQDTFDYMSDYLCGKYEEMYGKKFLFSNECVSYEIEYHVDAYMCVAGYDGYNRKFSTFFFTKKKLSESCGVVNISTKDCNRVAQRFIFKYRKGIRSEYIGTKNDPFHRF